MVAAVSTTWDYAEGTSKPFMATGSFSFCYAPITNSPKVLLLYLSA